MCTAGKVKQATTRTLRPTAVLSISAGCCPRLTNERVNRCRFVRVERDSGTIEINEEPTLLRLSQQLFTQTIQLNRRSVIILRFEDVLLYKYNSQHCHAYMLIFYANAVSLRKTERNQDGIKGSVHYLYSVVMILICVLVILRI